MHFRRSAAGASRILEVGWQKTKERQFTVRIYVSLVSGYEKLHQRFFFRALSLLTYLQFVV